MLIENDKMVLDNEAVSEEFKLFFEYVDGIGNVVSKFKTHSSTVKFKKHFKIKNTFSFSSGSKYEIIV